MGKYEAFQRYTTVDCNIFEAENYICRYNEMEFTAEIRPYYRYLDLSYKKDKEGNYEKPDKSARVIDQDRVVSEGFNISMDVKMFCSNNVCILIPRLSFSTEYYPYLHTCEDIIIKHGENRYRITPKEITTRRRSNDYEAIANAYMTVPLGKKDLEVLKEIAAGDYEVKVKIGRTNQRAKVLSDKDLTALKSFLEVCEKAGVIEQEALNNEPVHLVQFTFFNP